MAPLFLQVITFRLMMRLQPPFFVQMALRMEHLSSIPFLAISQLPFYTITTSLPLAILTNIYTFLVRIIFGERMGLLTALNYLTLRQN